MTARPAIKPAERRQLVRENLEAGYIVKVYADGSMEFRPAKKTDDDDLSDVRMGK